MKKGYDKYTHCTCERHQEILVGRKGYKYFNIALVGCYIYLTITFLWMLPVTGKIAWVLGSVLTAIVYTPFKKSMLKAGHTKTCSERIARLAALYYGLWSDFKILPSTKNDEERTR